MKKDIVMYENGSFVDFQGVERKFVVCALSTSNFGADVSVELNAVDDYEGTILGGVDIKRALFIGVSVCNPKDEWNEEKGKMIALAKARGFKASAPEKSAALFTTRSGMINEALVNCVLAREIEHIKADPEYVIKGYNQMKATFEQRQEEQKFIAESSPEVLDVADKFLALSDEDKSRVISVAVIKTAHE